MDQNWVTLTCYYIRMRAKQHEQMYHILQFNSSKLNHLLNNLQHVRTWASCQIHKIAGAHAPGMPGTFSPRPRVSDPDMHHGTCVTHVPWCMSGSLTSGFLWSRSRGKTFPAFPAHAQPATLRIWKEAHCALVHQYCQCHIFDYIYSFVVWLRYFLWCWITYVYDLQRIRNLN